MDNTISRDISARFWSLPHKADEEAERETLFIDDIIQKAHIERTILSSLEGIRTVFDGGGGTGRFSILLAKRGLHVTHFDISQPMLDKARARAAREGMLDNMTFVHGSLEDLSAYRNSQFDLALSFDAPVSYTYPHQETVIGELARIAAKRLILSVYSRPGYMTYVFNPIQKQPYILAPDSDHPLVRWYREHEQDPGSFIPDMALARTVLTTGLMESPEAVARAYEQGQTPWPVSYAFMPDELRSILERCGARDVRLAGPGALARFIPGEVLRTIMRDEASKQEFLELCYEYDSQPWCLGMAKDNLVATAELDIK